jgi:ribonuclease BN (tRNA processing enzyme)
LRLEKVSVKFLGSGDAFGSGGRFQTCIFVDSSEIGFLLDCGASSLIAMRRFGVSPSDVDAILITHLHGDHFGGIPFFILDSQMISRRNNPLLIAGPPGLEERVHRSMEVLFPGSTQIEQRFPIDFAELPEGVPTRLGALLVTPERVVHASGAPPYALRVAVAGKTLTFSGDTEWADSLIKAASGADLFICESYVYDKEMKFHIDYQTLINRRKELGCKRLVLTHMSKDMLDRLDSLDVEYAEDGKVIAL